MGEEPREGRENGSDRPAAVTAFAQVTDQIKEVLAPMQAPSSQLRLATGVSTRKFGTSSPAEATGSVPLLAEYAATWLDSIKGLVRPRTYEGYVYRLERALYHPGSTIVILARQIASWNGSGCRPARERPGPGTGCRRLRSRQAGDRRAVAAAGPFNCHLHQWGMGRPAQPHSGGPRRSSARSTCPRRSARPNKGRR